MASISGEIITKYDRLNTWQDCNGEKAKSSKIMWNAHTVIRTQKKTKDESRVCSTYVVYMIDYSFKAWWREQVIVWTRL